MDPKSGSAVDRSWESAHDVMWGALGLAECREVELKQRLSKTVQGLQNSLGLLTILKIKN